MRSAHHARRGRRPVRPVGRADRGHELRVGAPRSAAAPVRAARRPAWGRAGHGGAGRGMECRGVRRPRARDAEVPYPDRPAGRGAGGRAQPLDGRDGHLRRRSRRGPGPAVVARAGPPSRLLVGGGSDRLLGLAGRFADLLDLHGDPKHGRVAGATMAQASAGDVARRAHTTVDDLAGRIGLVRAAAEAAARARDAVGVATQIWYAAFGSPRGTARPRRSSASAGRHPLPATAVPTCCSAARADGRGAGGASRGLRARADLAQRGGRDHGRAARPAAVLPGGADRLLA